MTVPLATVHTIVSMAARGRRMQDIGDRTTLPLAVVRQIAESHGAPDLGALAVAADELRRQVDKETTHLGEGRTAADDVDTLKAAAERVGAFKLVMRVECIASLVDQLRVDVKDATQRWEAAAPERADRAAKLARLAELKAEEAKLRAELKGSVPAKSPAASTASATPPKAIREWAAAAGLTCPAMGPIPAAVREQYAKAVR